MYFDIGANIGKWALANIDTCDKIISIEASPLTFAKLLNHCQHKNIILLNYAVCDSTSEEITFYHAHCDTISTLNKDWLTSPSSRFHNQPFTEIKCKTITIDKLIEQYGVPELIKIDVEGAEYECLKSLTQKIDMICFEWASELNAVTFACLDHLASLGFTKFCVQNGDDYAFRPTPSSFQTLEEVQERIAKSVPKMDWGMIWSI